MLGFLTRIRLKERDGKLNDESDRKQIENRLDFISSFPGRKPVPNHRRN